MAAFTSIHEKYMKEALRQAKKAYALGEVPIGCVIVHEGRIIGRGYNRRNTDKNTLAHAEITAINKASKKIGDWRLEDCTLYVTLEPCQMCAGAIVQGAAQFLLGQGIVNTVAHEDQLVTPANLLGRCRNVHIFQIAHAQKAGQASTLGVAPGFLEGQQVVDRSGGQLVDVDVFPVELVQLAAAVQTDAAVATER